MLFVLPSMFILFGLSYIYMTFGTLPWVASIFDGLKAAVLAIVLAAVIKIGRKSLKNNLLIAVAVLSFPGHLFSEASLSCTYSHGRNPRHGRQSVFPEPVFSREQTGHLSCRTCKASGQPSSLSRNVKLLAVFVACGVSLSSGSTYLLPNSIFATEAFFFTKAAFLTFGGAYALLGYIAQAGVEHYGWLTSLQMMDGLGLAETTPGPLIMVVQFVGFLAGWNHPASLGPFYGSVTGSLVATYFTFLPSFMFIFLGAPYIERLIGNSKMSGALTTITPAVVGVILNLGVWFGTHVLLTTEGIAWFSALIAVVSFYLMQFCKVGIISIIAGAGVPDLSGICSVFNTSPDDNIYFSPSPAQASVSSKHRYVC